MMKKRSIIFSIIYALIQISQGLLLHPHQTMQSLVRDKVFMWMSLLPTVWLGVMWLGWAKLVGPLLALTMPRFLAYWAISFCFYWQGLLLYLLLRFVLGFRAQD